MLRRIISNRNNTGVTLSIYTEYDSNEHGDYTYFIGEEVNSFDNVPADFEVYDQRASDPTNASLDIYIGIK